MTRPSSSDLAELNDSTSLALGGRGGRLGAIRECVACIEGAAKRQKPSEGSSDDRLLGKAVSTGLSILRQLENVPDHKHQKTRKRAPFPFRFF